MNRNLFKCAILLFGTALVTTSCKDDSEDNLNAGSDVTGLFINEVCSSGTDWVELYNASDKDIALDGYKLQDNKGAEEEYTFPAHTVIAAKSFLTIEKETNFTFGISSKGDEIKLLDSSYKTIDQVTIPALEDGQTFARKTDGGSEWAVAAAGTKGKANTSTPDVNPGESTGESSVKLLLNEVVSAPAEGGFDFIEIFNPGAQEVNIGGFILQDDKGETEQYIIPEGTVIAANGIICFSQAQKENPDGSFTFGLSSKGDKVTFLDKQGKKIDQVEIPAMEKGTSYARIPNGAASWQVCNTPTKGQDNAGQAVSSLKGVLLINEVYTFSDQTDINDLDYIEIYNSSDKAVNMSGLKLWEGGGQAEAWTVPAGKTIPAKGFLVIECDKEGLHKDPTNYPSWGLSKNDETIVLADANLTVIDQVSTPNMSKGEAYGKKTDGAAEWVIFTKLTRGKSNNGTPEKQAVTNTTGVYINEVFTNDQKDKVSAWDDTKDFIELYNSTSKDVNLSGYSLMDDAMKEDKRYTFPQGTIIKAHSFLTVDVYKKNTNGPAFGLGKSGDKVLFYNTEKVLIDEIVTSKFEDNEIYSTGRKTDGGSEIVVFTEVSKNASNNGKETKQ